MREGDLDALGVESVLDPAECLALHQPAIVGADLHHTSENDGGVAKRINTEDLGLFDDLVRPVGVRRELGQLVTEHGERRVDIDPIGDPDVDDDLRELLGEIRRDVDLTVRHVVHVAVEIPEHRDAETDVLDCAGNAGDPDENPAMMSLTRSCAPKPTATPTADPTASSGVIGMPTTIATVKTPTTTNRIWITLRNIDHSVWARAAESPPLSAMRLTMPRAKRAITK